MNGLGDWLRRQGTNLYLVLGLGAATAFLMLFGFVSLLAVNPDDDASSQVLAGAAFGEAEEQVEEILEGEVTTTTAVAGTSDATVPGGAPAPGRTNTTAGKTGTNTAVNPGGTLPSAPGADRTGVTQGEIKWALHAPVTFDGAPLNLAEDPLEGVKNYVTFLNNNGGVNGRKINYQVFDDRYTVDGGQQAANAAINDFKPFFVSGTLGVDQIAQVAAEARKRNAPYLAAGGTESEFKDIGMFQIAASYDTHLEKLADFLAVETKRQGSIYFGLKKVGVSALDSPYIEPSVNRSFKNALERNGLELAKVVTVKKPTEQTSYATEISQLKSAGVEIFVPAQDPITTSREVQECASQRCTWKYTASNFAHESDTALTLMGGAWVGVRALAGGCYYLAPTANDSAQCGAMKQAHEEWVAVSSESEWRKDGSGGASGYQIVHIWLKALKDAGPDPTREKFKAALLTYDNYSDLVSGPITYKGSANLTHGATKMVVLEGTANPGADSGNTGTWRQVTPGFVDSF